MKVFDEAGVPLYALFSGGHDSLCSTALAAKHHMFRGVIHLNTGIGIEETREFVRATCKSQGWPLNELRAPDGLYEKMVITRGGFPFGPAAHNAFLWHLKQRPLDQWYVTTTGPIGMVTGIRRAESSRRMHAEISVPIRRKRRKVWISPLLDWSKTDCNAFMEQEGLPRNPVVDLIHRSGECLCGALARADEIHELAAWYPAAAKRINKLEHECERRGIVSNTWASSEARRLPEGQMQMFSKADLAPLCVSCEAR